MPRISEAIFWISRIICACSRRRRNRAFSLRSCSFSAYPSDDWGAAYIIDADVGAMTATIRLLYDGDDAGDGQFTHPDMGLRNPDNLDWADNGMIYVQEDRSTRRTTFGKKSGIEASVWELNPATGKLVRIAVIDRSALPPGQTDSDPTDLGDWESSGVLDVTRLFTTAPGEGAAGWKRSGPQRPRWPHQTIRPRPGRTDRVLLEAAVISS